MVLDVNMYFAHKQIDVAVNFHALTFNIDALSEVATVFTRVKGVPSQGQVAKQSPPFFIIFCLNKFLLIDFFRHCFRSGAQESRARR